MKKNYLWIFSCVFAVPSWLQKSAKKEYNINDYDRVTDFLPKLQTCETGARMHNGVAATNVNWAFIVSLHSSPHEIADDGNFTQFCGGTLIGRDSVLTAAHCCDPNKPETPTEIWARFKNQAFESRDQTPRIEYELKIIERIIHPNYNGIQNGNDLCILKTDGDVRAAKAAKSYALPKIACLADKNPDHGMACWVAGWGINEENEKATRLKQIGVNIFSKNWCETSEQVRITESIGENNICAGLPDLDGDGFTDGGKDACHGDSGGPLICNYHGAATLVGVVSYGRGCGLNGYPGVYSTVSDNLEWIRVQKAKIVKPQPSVPTMPTKMSTKTHSTTTTRTTTTAGTTIARTTTAKTTSEKCGMNLGFTDFAKCWGLSSFIMPEF